MNIIIKNATAVTMNDECPVINNAFIGIDGGKIVYIGQKEPKIAAKRTIDACGNIVMPGLVNTHTHIPMTIMRGYADDYNLQDWLENHVFPAEDRLDARCVKASALLGAMECIRGGITSISDMYFYIPAVAEAVFEAGIKANICIGPVALDREGYDFESSSETAEMREMLDKWHMIDGGRIKLDAAIHGEYTSFDHVWDKTVEFANEHELNTHVHLSETAFEHEECVKRHGKTPAQVLCEHGLFDRRATAAHCVHVSDEDIEILRNKRVNVAHNSVSNLKLGSGIARVAKMLEMGVNVSVATDGVCSNNSHDMFEEIKTAAILQKGVNRDPKLIPAYQALKMATVNPAFGQGRECECGRLSEGFDADIIMINTDAPNLYPVHNPVSTLVYSARGLDVCMTMVRGRILYDNGKFETLDFEKIKHELDRYVMPRVFGA